MKNPLVLPLAALLGLSPGTTAAPETGWKFSGSLHILTTPDGAGLPESAVVGDFPLLVRLDQDFFDFSQAGAGGGDLRFSAGGKVLVYQIEEWDAARGAAAIWVRIPLIKGNTCQEIRMHWGKAGAAGGSDGAAVFNASNGHLSVWHLGDEEVRDEAGTLESEDKGTAAVAGIIGKARHFPGKQGVFCGDKIAGYPSGEGPHTTSLWFRAGQPNGTVIGWGNEGGGRGSKIRMQFRSPPHIHIDSDFSDIKAESPLPMNEWIHVVHTYGDGPRKIYINGRLDGEAATKLDIKSPARLWLGGWYNNYDFVGDLDEVRISNVARSADWVRLEYENQKPLQTLVGPLVQPGSEFSVSETSLTVNEGESVTLAAKAGGARKLYWALLRDGAETVLAVDRFKLRFDAGRVTGDRSQVIRLRAVCAGGSRTIDIPVTVRETIPDPVFTLRAPDRWDGRGTIEVVPQVSNADEMRAKGIGALNFRWAVSGIATIHETVPDKLVFKRAQNSGELKVALTLDNGGAEVRAATVIRVQEPAQDAWVQRKPDNDEKPLDGQFYARDDHNEGTLHCNGTLPARAGSVFLKVYAGDELFKQESQQPAADLSYAFAVKLKPGLVKYRIEFGTRDGDSESVLHSAADLVCGDAYLIDGQSNALATDTGEESPRETNEWVRSYADPRRLRQGDEQNPWCRPVWKAQQEHTAELGWWGMELAKRLVESQQLPIFMINGAVGGTRIDQHQRNDADPEDLETIYGRMLWRVRGARLTHGIRAILWHQGENDQGTAGPDGGYGWESYQRYFIGMSADWKQDFPNLRHYYVYQIWPNSCSMGGGNGDMLREVQRTLPALYSNMDILSTLGIEPPGPCHFPLAGWTQFARLVQPLIERDSHGWVLNRPMAAPNLRRAWFTGDAKRGVVLEFDQAVVWNDSLAGEFYLDGAGGAVASGAASGNLLTLELKESPPARSITYLREMSWSQQRLLRGENGIAALSFCNVPILAEKPLP